MASTAFQINGTVQQIATALSAGPNIVFLTEYRPTYPNPPVVFQFAIAPEEKIEFKGVASIAEVPIPGAEGSILQPMGAEPLRWNWKGILEDVFDPLGNLVRRAVTDVQMLDSMRLSGKVWVFQYLDLQYECMIKRFNSTPVSIRGNLDRFEYEIEFTRYYPNLGLAAPQTAQVLAQATSNITSAIQSIQNTAALVSSFLVLAQNATADVSQVIMAPQAAFSGLDDTLTDQVTDTLSQITTVVSNTKGGVITPASKLQLLQQQVQFNIATTETVRTNVSTVQSVDQGIIIALHDIETELEFLLNIPALQPPPPTAYTVKEGDRIEDVALAYYGTGEAWRPIAYANELTNPSDLAVGQVLLIPT